MQKALDALQRAGEPGMYRALKRTLFERNEPCFTQLYWHPPRIVNGLIEATRIPQYNGRRIEIVNAASRFALQAYAKGVTESSVSKMTEVVSAEGLMDADLSPPIDQISRRSLYSRHIQSMAGRLQEKTGSAPLFIVPIGNGGVAHGFATALEYGALVPETDARVYPIRFSTKKSRHIKPHVSQEENDHIIAGSIDRTLVLVDDDAYSGSTVRRAVDHFRKQGASDVIGIVASDQRESLPDGEWWERNCAHQPIV